MVANIETRLLANIDTGLLANYVILMVANYGTGLLANYDIFLCQILLHTFTSIKFSRTIGRMVLRMKSTT
jgi:hypothetical protein